MNKLKMAHDWYLKHAGGAESHLELEVSLAWKYADAMQAEADKRDDKTRPAVLSGSVHPTVMSMNEFSDACVKPNLEEWQPDWSQAPYGAMWWAMDLNGCTYWYFGGEPLMSSKMWVREHPYTQEKAGSYGYTGSWRNSLRKRPE